MYGSSYLLKASCLGGLGLHRTLTVLSAPGVSLLRQTYTNAANSLACAE